MKLYYDFHIHSALSPCGDNDMTPNNIINMALLKGLDLIAVTDHNSCKNVEACLEVAKETSLLVVPGMELETMEEIHVVCLLPDIDTAKAFDNYVESRLNKIKNKTDIFGNQYLMDSEDEIIGEYENLLVTSTCIDLYTLTNEIKNFDGIAIPAHVDRSSYSVISNLGFIPDDLDISHIEISRHSDPEAYLAANKRHFLKDYKILRNSDAHYLGDVSERTHFLELPENPSAKDIISYLRSEY